MEVILKFIFVISPRLRLGRNVLIMVAPNLDRTYIVVTNSRDFGVTEDVCNEMISKLIRMDLRSNND